MYKIKFIAVALFNFIDGLFVPLFDELMTNRKIKKLKDC